MTWVKMMNAPERERERDLPRNDEGVKSMCTDGGYSLFLKFMLLKF